MRLFLCACLCALWSTRPAVADELLGKDLQAAVRGLDRDDPAVRWGLSLRQEAGALIGGGAGLVGVSLLGAGIESGVRQGGTPVMPYVAALAVPGGLATLTAGLPATLTSQRFLAWYALNGPAPTRIARLKLLHRWRVELLQVRRDTELIGSSFFGAAAILSGVVWATRDARGFNGTVGQVYDPGDGLITLGMTLGGGASALIGLLAHLEWAEEVRRPHRLYQEGSTLQLGAPTVSLGPDFVGIGWSGRF